MCVVPADAGREQDVALLIVGDSLDARLAVPERDSHACSRSRAVRSGRCLRTSQPPLRRTSPMRATEAGPGGPLTRVSIRTVRWRLGPIAARSCSTADQQTPTLDIGRYIAERLRGRAPDYVTFMLGINDCFGLKADDPQAVDAGITNIFQEADKLLAAFRQAAPCEELGVCLTTPPNIRDAAFVANYKTAYPRWNWRQVQHRLVERQLRISAGGEREHLRRADRTEPRYRRRLPGQQRRPPECHRLPANRREHLRLAQVAAGRPRRQEKL